MVGNNSGFVLINTMIRWADPDPNMEKPPQEILEVGFYRASFRCSKMLNEDERTRNIPVILYTILDIEDIEEIEDEIKNLPQVTYLIKGFNEKNLVEVIQS